MTVAEKARTRRLGDRFRFFTVAYYGTGDRFILTETLKAYSIENANERAERAMPPGAATYKVTDETGRN
jgi:hypothetical protein